MGPTMDPWAQSGKAANDMGATWKAFWACNSLYAQQPQQADMRPMNKPQLRCRLLVRFADHYTDTLTSREKFPPVIRGMNHRQVETQISAPTSHLQPRTSHGRFGVPRRILWRTNLPSVSSSSLQFGVKFQKTGPAKMGGGGQRVVFHTAYKTCYNYAQKSAHETVLWIPTSTQNCPWEVFKHVPFRTVPGQAITRGYCIHARQLVR
jgi:hypothetical protein